MPPDRESLFRRATGFRGKQLATGMVGVLVLALLLPVGARAATTVVSIVDGGSSAGGTNARVLGGTLTVNALPGAPLGRVEEGSVALSAKTPLLKVGGGFAGLSNLIVANRGTSASTVEIRTGVLDTGTCSQVTPAATFLVLRVPANNTIGVPLAQSIVFGSNSQPICVLAQEVSGGLVNASFTFWNINATTFQLQ